MYVMWPTIRATAKPAGRRLRAVVISVVPIGVGHNRLPAHFVERDLLRAVPRRGCDRKRRRDAIRIRHRPFQRLHASHRPARNRQQLLNPQIIDQHLLQPHHVGDGHHRKRHRPRLARLRIDRRRPRRAAAPAQNVGADHEVLVGVEGLARARSCFDQPGPPSPAACASPEKACSTRIAFDLLAFKVPYVS